jgi:hypothetical protein
MVEVESKNRFLGYCLSNAAAQVVAGLVDMMSAQQYKKEKMKVLYEVKTSAEFENLLQRLLENVESGKPRFVPCELETKQHEQHSNVGTPANTYFDQADALSSKYAIENDVLIQFINPQVNFEVSDDSGISQGLILLTALRMQVKFLLLIDAYGQITFDKEKQDTIAKFRNIWSLEAVQFLVYEKESADSFSDNVPWIPLECIMNHNIHVTNFGRIIDHARVVFQTERSNPIFVDRGDGSSSNDPDTFNFNIPVLRATATSLQYMAVFDLFKNLLVYSDPESGQRSERLKQMLLALEQCEDIQFYRFTVLSLQEKVRQTEFLLQYRKRGGKVLSSIEMQEVRKSWIEYRNDLFVLVESLQNLQNIERKRKSLNISWQFIVDIDEFIWLLQQDDNSCLCKWSIDALNFCWVNNEDQSTVNTLEINSTNIENLSQTPNMMFREVLSHYNPDNREFNFEKQKMIRVYWREGAPVAGIQVVTHFEVNIQPLLIQLTKEFGFSLAKYIFPSLLKKESKEVRITASHPNQEKPPNAIFQYGDGESNQLQQMQVRADQNKSFIYIKVPGVQHCLSYRGSKEKNFEDLTKFPFYLPTLEYRNKTWTWLDFLNAIKKGTLKINIRCTSSRSRQHRGISTGENFQQKGCYGRIKRTFRSSSYTF